MLARVWQMVTVTIRRRLSEKHTLMISVLLSCYNWTQGFHILVIQPGDNTWGKCFSTFLSWQPGESCGYLHAIFPQTIPVSRVSQSSSKLSMGAHISNLSTWEEETHGSLWLPGQPSLYSNNKKKWDQKGSLMITWLTRSSHPALSDYTSHFS